jgi:hypothetical protein
MAPAMGAQILILSVTAVSLKARMAARNCRAIDSDKMRYAMIRGYAADLPTAGQKMVFARGLSQGNPDKVLTLGPGYLAAFIIPQFLHV